MLSSDRAALFAASVCNLSCLYSLIIAYSFIRSFIIHSFIYMRLIYSSVYLFIYCFLVSLPFILHSTHHHGHGYHNHYQARPYFYTNKNSLSVRQHQGGALQQAASKESGAPQDSTQAGWTHTSIAGAVVGVGAVVVAAVVVIAMVVRRSRRYSSYGPI